MTLAPPPWSRRDGVVFPRSVEERHNLREVAPGLYVGNAGAPFYTRSWGLVVDMCGSSAGKRHLIGKGLLLVRDLADGEAIPEHHLDEIAGLTQESLSEDLPVLVHCAAGLSRSVSVVYGLLRVGWGLDRAEALRRSRGPVKRPNEAYPLFKTLWSADAWAESRVRR